MIFRPELADAVMGGRKTVTRRLCSENPRSPWWVGGCSYDVGQVFTVNPGRGKVNIGSARVVDVERQRLGDAFGDTFGVDDTGRDGDGDEEARREGFRGATAFKLAWLAINHTYDPDAVVWRIEFEAIQP